ncbi:MULTISPECIES: tRNA pseudouridine(55) synthase TruB [Sphingobium]|jgi:tRNA pseudouridine55 synthase|uniref:tRNA pseudouridine synthase B n=1 Tax=Sphingobium yanoikuyae TaxID=13690 RepID=A0A0J9FIN2_SPHYA|nr:MULTISPECIES: tRNA pseudouridine(55) synthase TruB [Sphingobium]ATP18738.1 tRNA pseudouridine(55) synthase TruB [Sphingobium yanoikuyae]KMW28405.1 pseudouridine synthase [Sphingobium yanoikuyae]TKV43693.1 tRNA pseudouridine(55) synthase [Sphingobium sp. MP9-4]
MHGWIILDKPHGLGSTQAVSAVKRALRTQREVLGGTEKWKVGHGGTLDPLATGVLPIAIGEATKLAGRMLDSDKIYDFTIAFGAQTDTLDLEGKVIAESEVRPTLTQLEAILPRFTGPIEQAPPAYSAILIDGQRAYDLARKGEEVEMKTRSVTIHALAIAGQEQEEGALASVTLRAHVSKGTYIRSLARDIALALGTVGHVTMLRRIKAGPFTLETAISLDKLDEAARGGDIGELMLPLTAGLDDIPALAVSPDEALALRQGKMLMGKPHTGLLLAMLGDTPVALVESSGPEIRVVRGFNL